jgi:hypothetical protein
MLAGKRSIVVLAFLLASLEKVEQRWHTPQ